VNDPETFWSQILSRDPAVIQQAWQDLTPEEMSSVYAHLERMTTEEGWATPQRISAQAALDAIDSAQDDE
jgi:hypothetical protein